MASIIKADTLQSTTANVFVLNSAGTEYARFDASGNMGIGTTSPGVKLDVQDITAIARLTSTTGTNAVRHQVINTGGTSQFGRESSGGGTILSGADGYSTVLTGAGAYPMVFGTNSTERMRINAGAPILCLSGGSTTATGTGIAFPATQSASADANTLDDYEEGTWTPILGGATSETGQTYNVNSGSYTKIGNQVFCTMRVSLATAGTITGNAVIKGLPFTSNSSSTDYAGVSFAFISPTGTAIVSVNGLVQQSRTSIDIYYRTAASTTQTTAGNTFWVATDVYASVVYHTS